MSEYTHLSGAWPISFVGRSRNAALRPGERRSGRLDFVKRVSEREKRERKDEDEQGKLASSISLEATDGERWIRN
jgi:hypothetical protein